MDMGQPLGCPPSEPGRVSEPIAFVNLIPQAHLPYPNEARNFACNGKMICLANVWAEITAMDNQCLHQGLARPGTIEDGKLVCPWHGWKWG
jgi:nitrite reductase (NADH) small subunit